MVESVSSANRKKLKNHLKKKPVDFVPTDTVAWYWWHVINKAAFNNALPKPKDIIIRKMRGNWGTCECSPDGVNCTSLITLCTSLTDKKLFISTLAHEMVHSWQGHFGKGNLDHGSVFKDWQSYFKKKFDIIL